MSTQLLCYEINNPSDLVTSYEETRAGFLALALEKNTRATPYVQEAISLKTLVSRQARKPEDILGLTDIRPAILTAAGVSDKAAAHLTEEDQIKAITELIERFLKPSGEKFIDELVFRFLLTKGDALGGKMRNLAGLLAERKLSRSIISVLSLSHRQYKWLDKNSRRWLDGKFGQVGTEETVLGFYWQNPRGEDRLLVYNRTVPIVGKNVDLSLLSIKFGDFKNAKGQAECYIALGELKGGIDPAGADEHWKTANSALDRIRDAFGKKGFAPKTFFVGAAIELSMSKEIYRQLEEGKLNCAVNLTKDSQLTALCKWLIDL